jgi:hypothetical protein
MSNTTINFSLTSLCQQRSKQLLFNTPLPRYTPISPYGGGFTKFQLDMRRKIEVLKYNSNTSSTKTNNLTKAEKWSQIVNGNSNNQRSNFPSIHLTLINYEGNYSVFTVKYPDTIETVQTSQYTTDSFENIILNINAYQIVGNSGYYYINIIKGGALKQCNINEVIPTPTSFSGVPGPVVYLINDETVPLYNYNKNTQSYSYDSNVKQDKLWLYNPTSDIFLTNKNSKIILTMMVSNIVERPSYNFTLKIPFSLYATGTNISDKVLSDSMNNPYNFYGLNIEIKSIEFNVFYSNNKIEFINQPTINISGSPLRYTNGEYIVDDSSMNFNIIFNEAPTSSSDYYTAKLYIGYITISNININTQPGYVYDFFLKVNLSNINFDNDNNNDKINNYNNSIQNTLIGTYINSSTNLVEYNTDIMIPSSIPPYIGGITLE